eukprot:TRINITY_DN15824_c0_g1_i4.p1 TRINITY_DN15824_c0_g1~~TRINITY_DN15824_c0_g1_i4.p1  ORF type:complete len:634 (+),score=69.44 TRINITY_DN15824_c0_g1_i4:124-1902(+)
MENDRAIFGDAVQLVSENQKTENTLALDPSCFHAFTLQRATVHKDVYPVRDEIKAASDGDIQFDAEIRCGAGFTKRDGLIPRQLLEGRSLQGWLVVVVAGYNDTQDVAEFGVVENSINDFARFFTSRGAHIAFIEPNDSYSNMKLVSRHFEHLANTMEKVSFIKTELVDCDAWVQKPKRRWGPILFPIPQTGWACEGYKYDRAHLTKDGLLQWLPAVLDCAKRLAKKSGCSRVFFVTDSTFAGHDYSGSRGSYDGAIHITVKTLSGTLRFRIDAPATETIHALKERVAAALQCANSSNITLMRAIRRYELEDHRTLSHYGLKDGSVVLLLLRASLPQPATVGHTEAAMSRDVRFVPRGLFTEFRVVSKQPFEVAIDMNVGLYYDDGNAGWMQSEPHSGWIDSYHSTGLWSGRTLAEVGFKLSRGYDGVYSVTDKDLAFEYAARFESANCQPSRWYQIIVQNRVRNAWQIGDTSFLCNEDREGSDDVRPVRLLVRVTQEASESSLSVCRSLRLPISWQFFDEAQGDILPENLTTGGLDDVDLAAATQAVEDDDLRIWSHVNGSRRACMRVSCPSVRSRRSPATFQRRLMENAS